MKSVPKMVPTFCQPKCKDAAPLQDRDESTLELSLFAEGFQDMLARDYGERILKSLYTERWGTLPLP